MIILNQTGTHGSIDVTDYLSFDAVISDNERARPGHNEEPPKMFPLQTITDLLRNKQSDVLGMECGRTMESDNRRSKFHLFEESM